MLIYYCRFLNQINVRDTRTGKTYHFVCNKWLIPDEDGDVVTYNLTSVKVHSYMYTFRVKSLQNLRDQHLWVSIFVCPRHTTFSRVQRLSCAFAFIMSSMLVNLMFYGVNVSIVHEDLLYYSTHLDLEKIVIGTQSALITVPVNVLIVLIFRSVSPRDETHDVRPGIDENSDSYSSDESTSNDVGSYIDDNDTINNGTGDVQSNDSSDSDDIESEVPVHVNKSKGLRLPWWCVYIGWALNISTCVVSSYVALMYGLSFGFHKSVAWLTSFIASTTQNIGVVQPLKVAIIASVVTFLFKTPVQPIADITHRVNIGR